MHHRPDARHAFADLGLAAQHLLVLQHHGPDRQTRRVALLQHLRGARKGIRPPYGIAPGGRGLAFAFDETAAPRAVDFLPQDGALAVEGRKAHAVGMVRQHDIAAKEQVAEFIERCRWAAHERDALALADAAHQAVDARTTARSVPCPRPVTPREPYNSIWILPAATPFRPAANNRAARMGPTVCELDGPIPILNNSKMLVFSEC